MPPSLRLRFDSGCSAHPVCAQHPFSDLPLFRAAYTSSCVYVCERERERDRQREGACRLPSPSPLTPFLKDRAREAGRAGVLSCTVTPSLPSSSASLPELPPLSPSPLLILSSPPPLPVALSQPPSNSSPSPSPSPFIEVCRYRLCLIPHPVCMCV